MDSVTWQAWTTVGVILGIVIALLREVARPDLVFMGGLGVLLAAGVVTPHDAFAGFANPAVLTIAALFIVAAGVQRTEALSGLDRVLFARSKRLGRVLPQLMVPTSFLSAFLNNTPIVAMLTPRVQQWARKHGVSASKLLIPLSYASIAGGMVTLIGTSTNIVVSGLLVEFGLPGLGMFELAWIGLPVATCVLVYFALVGHRLLPDHGDAQPVFENGLNECLFELRVAPGAPLVGQTVEEARLRSLGDAYLVHVRRDGRLIQVTPEVILQEGDTLTFVGEARMLERLLTRPGLVRTFPALEPDARQTLPLFEAVVADSSRLAGKTLREADFREQFGGVVLAIQRRSERMDGSLGRIPIKPGDLLLVEAQNGFDRRWNARRDEFYLVAPHRDEEKRPLTRKAPLALAIIVGMIAAAATGLLPLVTAAFFAALLMIVTRCVQGDEARKAINFQVLIIIAAALGIGQAMEQTGLAGVVAHSIVGLAAEGGVVVILLGLYVVTNVFTELFTNNAAAALMIPIAVATASETGVDPKALGITVAIAASASFITPIGYQTNLMVMTPGGYRFRDYVKVGLPVSLFVMAVAVTAIYGFWIV